MKKLELMHSIFGKMEGKKCKDCCNFISDRYHDTILHKCQAYGMTHSEASDWRCKWDACGIYNQPYDGHTVMGRGTREATAVVEQPMEGQIDLFGGEESGIR